jgi:hypothetical protein
LYGRFQRQREGSAGNRQNHQKCFFVCAFDLILDGIAHGDRNSTKLPTPCLHGWPEAERCRTNFGAGLQFSRPGWVAPPSTKKSAPCLFSRLGSEGLAENFGRVADVRSLRGAALSLQSSHQQDGQMIVWMSPCDISMCESRQRRSLPLSISAKRVTHEAGCPLAA